jgi:hypothetical protein
MTARQTLETLHPDIVRSEAEAERRTVTVTDPAPGIWGGEPVEGLVGIEYACRCSYFPALPRNEAGEHTHGALYGPPMHSDPVTGELVVSGEPGFSLYAD